MREYREYLRSKIGELICENRRLTDKLLFAAESNNLWTSCAQGMGHDIRENHIAIIRPQRLLCQLV